MKYYVVRFLIVVCVMTFLVASVKQEVNRLGMFKFSFLNSGDTLEIIPIWVPLNIL